MVQYLKFRYLKMISPRRHSFDQPPQHPARNGARRVRARGRPPVGWGKNTGGSSRGGWKRGSFLAICKWISIYMLTYMHIYIIYIHIYVHVYIYIYVRVYIYIYSYMGQATEWGLSNSGKKWNDPVVGSNGNVHEIWWGWPSWPDTYSWWWNMACWFDAFPRKLHIYFGDPQLAGRKSMYHMINRDISGCISTPVKPGGWCPNEPNCNRLVSMTCNNIGLL